MPHSTTLPLCAVVGRDDRTFLRLSKKFQQKAKFYQTDEASCLEDIARSGADIAVVLWSETSRTCAQSVHRLNSTVNIILEQNSASLSGLGERNGFLSVIERSQDRTQLFTQVEAALAGDPCKSKPCDADEENVDSHAVLARMASIPTDAGDTHRVAEYLLDLFLGATRSGAGGVFLWDTVADGFTPVAVRNLASGVDSLRILRTSKIVGIFSASRKPFSMSAKQQPEILSWADRLGCDYIVPLQWGGSLQGWLCLNLGASISRLEQSTIVSLGLFSAEMLKQSGASRSAVERIERDTILLTRISEALARVKLSGELEIIHDESRLISFRGNRTSGSYQKLTSSKLKAVVFQALGGQLEDFQLVHTKTGRAIEGKVHRLPDKSLIVHLRWTTPPLSGDDVQLRHQGWRSLALDAVSTPETSGLDSLSGPIKHLSSIRDYFANGASAYSLADLLDLTLKLLPKAEIDIRDGVQDSNLQLPFETFASLALLLISAGTRQTPSTKPPKITVQSSVKGGLRWQLDSNCNKRPLNSRLDKFETIASCGLSLTGCRATMAHAEFGERWEVCLSVLTPDYCDLKKNSPLTVAFPVCPSASQPGLNVLQKATSNVNKSQDAAHKNGTVAFSDNLCAARNT